jgi:hypothetical protein
MEYAETSLFVSSSNFEADTSMVSSFLSSFNGAQIDDGMSMSR